MARLSVLRRFVIASTVSAMVIIGVMSQTSRVMPFKVSSAAPFVAFTNSAAISIPTSGVAGLYPSNITVAGQTGVVTAVTVRLNGFSHTAPGDVDILLVSPDGKKFKVVSDAGSNTGAPGGQATVNVNVTFSDAGAAVLATGDTKWGADNSTFTARPTDYVVADTFPAPAPAGPYGTPSTTGTDTLNGFFNGATPNGTWSLYVVDDSAGDSGNISGGWTLDITTAAGSAATTTTVASATNPSQAGPVTFTATVTSSSTVNSGTVNFQVGGSDLTCSQGAQPIPVNASGQASCSTTLFAGNHIVTAIYNPGPGFLGSSGTVLQQVTLFTPPNIFSNPGAITIENPASPNPQQGNPYPGQILVGLGGTTISNLTVSLNGLSHADTTDVDLLLVGPTGAAYVLMSDAGNTSAVSNLNLTFSDSAASALPSGSAITSGTYRPTNYGAGDTFPNTSLGTVTASGSNTAAPAGSGTLLSAFGGTSPSGVWSLYIIDDAASGTGTLANGWSLTITFGFGAVTTTAVSSSNNPSFTTPPNNQTTFTATVTSNSNPVTDGNVNFRENGVDITCTEGAQPRPLNASGQATCTSSFNTEGQHIITAFYNGSPPNFAISNGQVTQTVNNQTTGVPPQFCNAGPLAIPTSGIGNPYPSQIFVSGLTGQATKVTAQLNALTHGDVSDVDVLLVGPGGQKIVLMSDAGGTGQAGTNLNLLFDDDAAALLPTSGAVSSGTYRPTDNAPADSWPVPAPAPPYGTTLAAFLASAPNGTWSIYVVDDTAGDTGTINGGVCLNFTMGTATTTTAVTSSVNPSANGQPVTFTATVTVTPPGTGTPTGSVQFRDGAANLGMPVTLNASGQAQLTTSTLTPGAHPITAVYTPTGNFTTSTSPILTQQVSVLTAAGVEISGRILTQEGRGVGRAVVMLTDSEGRTVTTTTTRGGYYRFTDVPSDATYTLAVTQGRFTFTPRVVQVIDNISNLDIIAEP